MKKFNVMRDTSEIKNVNDVESGCCINIDGGCPELLGSFNTAEEAISLFADYDADVHRYSAKLWGVTEVWVEEVEYDEEGELISVGDPIIMTDLTMEKYNAMSGYEIPSVEIGDITTINDIWNDVGETPKGCVVYRVTSDTDVVISFEITKPDEDDELDSQIKITDIVLK